MDRKERMQRLAPALVPWFETFGRSLPWREDASPYHVWISEIMLQQTRIEAVKPYYARFLQEIPDIPTLAAADPDRLHKLWEGLGYYSRVRNLQAAAQQIMTEFGGVFPDTFEQIRRLKGIGDYTAGAIASICFGRPTPAVDGNVLRVIARVTGDARPVTDEKTKASVREELVPLYPTGHTGSFTQGLMELGEILCGPGGEPACDRCPCRDFCASRDGAWMHLPVRAEKKARREETMTVFLLRCGDEVAIDRRGEEGLLSGWWEFPNVPGTLTAGEALRHLDAAGCRPERIRTEFTDRHVFTHVEWKMHCVAAECLAKPDCFVWVSPEELRERIALPTAFRKLEKKGFSAE